MGLETKIRKIERRKAEGVWTMVVAGVLGSCLGLVAINQIPLVPLASLFSNASKPALIGTAPGNGAAPPQAAALPLIDDDEIRTGSIVVQMRRDNCEQRLFDNYTGRILVMGTVSCEAAMARGREGKSGTERLQAISNAFRPR